MVSGHLGSESAVGDGNSRYRGTITGSGRGKIGDCVDCVLLVGVVGGLETSAVSGDLSVTPSKVGCNEVHLEVCPGLFGRMPLLPDIKVVDEEAELEGNIDHLLEGIGSIPCCCVIDGIFDLVE